MLTEQPVLITSIKAGENIPKNRFVDFNGILTGEGNKPLGISNAETNSGEMVPVVAQGIAVIEQQPQFQKVPLSIQQMTDMQVLIQQV